MKKLFMILVLVPFTTLCFGEETKDLFLAGNNAYSDGKYEEALSYYKQILDLGYESADLYYNMGNATFRSNRLGYAILYYKKALKLDPGHEEAQKNLDYVTLYTEDKLESVPQFFLKTWINALFSLFSLKIWSVLSFILFSLLLLGVLVYIFAGRLGLKKAGFFSALTILFLFVLTFSATLEKHHEVTHPHEAVVTSPSVIVKSSPSISGTDLFVLHEGTAISVEETVGDWIEIRISDGRIGWVENRTVEII